MSDLISRKAMIDAMRQHRAVFCKNRIEFMALPKDEKARVDEIDNCIANLVNMPSAEPERKTGHWSNYKDEHGCSVCHCVVISDCWDDEIRYDYCPYCGAEMSGE